jgi:hypothetical protein
MLSPRPSTHCTGIYRARLAVSEQNCSLWTCSSDRRYFWFSVAGHAIIPIIGSMFCDPTCDVFRLCRPLEDRRAFSNTVADDRVHVPRDVTSLKPLGTVAR